MYVMCHLLSGLLLGILLSLPSGDRRLALACTLGAVLPDMVDKPLGLLISGTVGYGRIYSHSLAMWLVLIGVCVAYWAFSRRTTRSPGLFIALGLGFFLHQALDAMWLQPATWFWPLLGPFPPGEEIALIPYILADILQPAEWLAGTAFLFLLAGLRGDVHPGVKISAGLSVLLGFSAFWLILCAAGGSLCPLTGWDSRGDNLVVALVLLGGAICIDWERGRVMPGGGEDPL